MFLLEWISPNQLTFARIAGIPVLAVLASFDTPVLNMVTVALFILVCLTDYWDGALARFRGDVSRLGKLLDPLADKMLITALLMVLVGQEKAHLIPSVAIMLREFAVTGLRQVAALEGVAVSVMVGAKWKTVLQMIATGILLASPNIFSVSLNQLGNAALWGAALWSLITGYSYFRSYFRLIRLNPSAE